MIDKVRSFLSQAAYGLYGLIFGFILYSVIFNNVSYTYDVNVLIKDMASIIGILLLVALIYSRFSYIFLKCRYFILAGVCIAVFAAQYNVGINVVHAAIYDHERVLNGAMLWAQGITGEEFVPYSNYIHYYTNNIGLFMVQQWLFRTAAAFGFTNFYEVAIFTGHILFSVMIIASFMYLDENISGHRALFFLLAICMFPPLYFQSSISYTDTWSVWGIPCMLLFISRGIRSEKMGWKIFYGIISALLMTVAVKIKTTVAIVVIALFIQTLVHNLTKKNVAFFAVLLAVFVTGSNLFTQWTYSTVRDKTRDIEAMPLTHWIMMGLQGDGSYNGSDEHRITLGVPPEKRVEKNLEVIRQRLGDMGVDGYMQLLYRKTCRTFGSGNAEVYYTFKYDTEFVTPFNFVYETTLEDGRYYPEFNKRSQAVYVSSIALGVVGALLAAIRKKEHGNFAPHIALIGFWLFMMLWESNHRQLINQWSLFFIVAAIGLYNITDVLFHFKTGKTDKTETVTTDSRL